VTFQEIHPLQAFKKIYHKVEQFSKFQMTKHVAAAQQLVLIYYSKFAIFAKAPRLMSYNSSWFITPHM